MTCARCGLQAFSYRSCPGCGAPFAVTEEVGPLHGPGMPARRWELTAPESYLLRYADFGGDSEWHAFKVGLMELVARRVLRLDGAHIPRRILPGSRTDWLLSDGPRMGPLDEPSLARVLAVYTRLRERQLDAGVTLGESARQVEGVGLIRLARAVTDGGSRPVTYLSGDVAAALQRRGLLSAEGERTPAGEQAEEGLDVWLSLARRAERFQHDGRWLRATCAEPAPPCCWSAPPIRRWRGSARYWHAEASPIRRSPPSGRTTGLRRQSTSFDILDFAGLDPVLLASDRIDGVVGVIEAIFVATSDGGRVILGGAAHGSQ
jgi:hypothetical protein